MRTGTFLLQVTLAFSLLALNSIAWAQVKPAAPAPAEGESYLLRYKLKSGEQIVSSVVHQARTATRIKGTDQIATARTSSDKVWVVKHVAPSGDAVIEYRIDRVEMKQQNGTDPEVSYDSTKDKTPPKIYTRVAEALGKPIAVVTIDSRGKVIKKDETKKDTPDLGMGDVAVPLPEEAVAIGGQWSVPRELRIKTRENTYKTIKIREQYTLIKVQSGVATMTIESQPITPLDTPEEESQVVQQLSNGEIRFDIDAGRLISKELTWEEKVVGFSGAESQLDYSARYTEQVKSATAVKTAAKPAPAVKTAAKPITKPSPRKK